MDPMPITDRNCELFYQGSCAELHVASLFYFAGYEAQKVSPDTGIDLIVTNLARERFHGESSRTAQVQIKSALMDASGASITITADELKFLCASDDRYTVLLLFRDLTKEPDHDDFDLYANQVDKLIDRDMAKYEEQLASDGGRAMRKEGVLSIHTFTGFKATVFWLNASQMRRAIGDQVWNASGNFYTMPVIVADDQVLVGTDKLLVVPQLLDVRYIMRDASCHANLRLGKFSLSQL